MLDVFDLCFFHFDLFCYLLLRAGLTWKVRGEVLMIQHRIGNFWQWTSLASQKKKRVACKMEIHMQALDGATG